MKKKLTLATIALAAMASCTNQPVGYTINGAVADSTLNGKTIYLIDVNTEEQPSDSAVITNNAYTFTSQEALAAPCVKRVFIGRAGNNVMVDNGVVVNIPATPGEQPSDNGGLNDKLATLMKNVSEKSMQLRETYRPVQAPTQYAPSSQPSRRRLWLFTQQQLKRTKITSLVHTYLQ